MRSKRLRGPCIPDLQPPSIHSRYLPERWTPTLPQVAIARDAANIVAIPCIRGVVPTSDKRLSDISAMIRTPLMYQEVMPKQNLCPYIDWL